MKRLAHAHEDKVSQGFAAISEEAGDIHDLGYDLSGGQMAPKTHLPRRAEYASHGAPDLGTDTGRSAAAKVHQHRLYRLAIGQAEQELAGMAIGTIDKRLRRQANGVGLGPQARTQIRSQAGHLRWADRELSIESSPHLAGVIVAVSPSGQQFA